MLSDHERHLLHGIEAELARDPDFAARMRAERTVGTTALVFGLCVLFYLAAPMASLLFGFTGVVVCAVALAGGITVVLVRRRRV